MTSTQSREFENSIRRETAFRLAEILKNRSTIRQILPVYEIQISATCCKRFLFAIDGPFVLNISLDLCMVKAGKTRSAGSVNPSGRQAQEKPADFPIGADQPEL